MQPLPPPPARSCRAPSAAACTSPAPSPHLSGRSAQSAPRPAAPAPPASLPDTASAETHTAPPPRAGSSHRAACAPAQPVARPPHSLPPPHERPPDWRGRSRDTRPSLACNRTACASPLELPPALPALAPPAPTASEPPPSSPPAVPQQICHPERTMSDPELAEGESKGKSKDLRFSPPPRVPAPRCSTSPQHNSARPRTSHTAPIASVCRETSLPQFKSPRTTAPRKNHPVLPAIPPAFALAVVCSCCHPERSEGSRRSPNTTAARTFLPENSPACF